MRFADVVLPLPLYNIFTYSIPNDLVYSIKVGCRVIVPFGARKYYTAIILKIHGDKPQKYEVKTIESIIDPHPLVNNQQLKLWEWISYYYMCSLGEVYMAAVPSKLKIESETFLSFIGNEEQEILSPNESKIVNYLRDKGTQKISLISRDIEVNNILPYVHSLVLRGIVDIKDNIKDKYRPKYETYIKLNHEVKDAFTVIGRAKKQLELYEYLMGLYNERGESVFRKRDIEKEYSSSSTVVKGLIDKGIITQFKQEVSRVNDSVVASREPYDLNKYQKEAFNSINNVFEHKNVCLLHGVTSSGKTEIYIHLIREQIEKNKQVLFLVPEIALTTQLTSRLQAVFGDKLGVYHSKIRDDERAEIWFRMQSHSPYEIIIGVRSSVLLPFQNLGLIVVDEEHEVGYKQMDPAPRYHARDTSIMLAHSFNAKVLLGSATPSIESYHNTVIGKYGLVTLSNRFEDIEMPIIQIENTKELRRKKLMKTLLTPLLIDGISDALENKQQVILFRNRRGFAPLLECKNCGWTPKCEACDVSLTYHKRQNILKCHYCNSTYRVVENCPVCVEKSIEQYGMGTEMLEEEVQCLFPDAVIERMDTDTTRKRNSYDRIIDDFQNKRTDILVGTQMLSKGLDFENVSIVGVIAADGLLNHPNFRSHERGFQLMMQAAGRAGRKNGQGRVVIQSADPELSLYKYLKAHDYVSFYHLQMAERRLFNYPPYTRLISIVFRHKVEKTVDSGANFFAATLRQSMGNMVLGPNKPVVSYIKTYHIRDILLKIDTNYSHVKVRSLIRSVEAQFVSIPEFKYVNLYYDVDIL